MSSTKEYKNYILDQLRCIESITYKPMMGEYLLYYKNVLIGGIYDDRLLIKKTKNNEKYNLQEAIPYKNAKSMFLVTDTDNEDLLKEIVIDTYENLSK